MWATRGRDTHGYGLPWRAMARPFVHLDSLTRGRDERRDTRGKLKKLYGQSQFIFDETRKAPHGKPKTRARTTLMKGAEA